MKLPSNFRRFVRKIARYAGPVGAGTILRGCPCPAPVFHPPQPYTSSLAVDADTTLDATPESWVAYCSEMCGDTLSECSVQINTSEDNGRQFTPPCNSQSITSATLATPWVSMCIKACGEEQYCNIGPDAAQGNKIIINCVSWWVDCAGGRSTEGISVSAAPASANPQAQLLARMATLEAESIPAFRRLARELAALGAPRKLRRQAARSRRDEQRHARTMTSLARRHGANPASVVDSQRTLPLRPLDEVAFENAIEGCIRETYGAWKAWQQASDAPDRELRTTMRRIAADEMRHAALAWDIHEWAMKRLDKNTQTMILRAMNDAWLVIAARNPGLQTRRTQKQS